MALNFTKNQNLILELFFNDPQKEYYLRELGRILKKQPGVFQKDINKLVENGILLSVFKANSRFFKLNKNNPLYKELKSIFFKTVGAEGQLKRILKDVKDIETAFIFGSYAKDKEDSFSDIDLMIIGNPDEDYIIKEISKLEKRIDREINYHIFSKQESKKENSFLKGVLSGKKIVLVENKK
jgi:predicted nucleotidyltransferase